MLPENSVPKDVQSSLSCSRAPQQYTGDELAPHQLPVTHAFNFVVCAGHDQQPTGPQRLSYCFFQTVKTCNCVTK